MVSLFNNFMKKILLTLTLSCLLFFSVANTVSALNLGSDIAGKAADVAGYDQTTETTLSQTIGSVIKAILSLAGVIFTVLMVYAGILWMTAHGEEDQITKAKKIITASIIGLAVALSAYSITAFVVPRLMGSGDSGFEQGQQPE